MAPAALEETPVERILTPPSDDAVSDGCALDITTSSIDTVPEATSTLVSEILQQHASDMTVELARDEDDESVPSTVEIAEAPVAHEEVVSELGQAETTVGGVVQDESHTGEGGGPEVEANGATAERKVERDGDTAPSESDTSTSDFTEVAVDCNDRTDSEWVEEPEREKLESDASANKDVDDASVRLKGTVEEPAQIASEDTKVPMPSNHGVITAETLALVQSFLQDKILENQCTSHAKDIQEFMAAHLSDAQLKEHVPAIVEAIAKHFNEQASASNADIPLEIQTSICIVEQMFVSAGRVSPLQDMYTAEEEEMLNQLE